MNRRNDEEDALNNISNIRKEILQLCNAPGSRTTDFHRLGFSCLLKKLHEIEKIVTGLKDMPIIAHSTPHTSRIQPVVTDHDLESTIDQSFPEVRANPRILSLPDDLTPNTKRVLFDIYNKIERSFDEFYENMKLKLKQSYEDNYRKLDDFMCSLRENLKTEIRMFIENVLLEENTNEPPSDTFYDDSSHIPLPQPDPFYQAPLPFTNVPVINMEVVKQTLKNPEVNVELKRDFFANLNALNDVINEISEQAKPTFRQPAREAPSNSLSNPEVHPQYEQEDVQFQPLTCSR
ncbi:uncharacterized protein LOC135839847 [Planococcus citri]|uniref:uncharacterized protein LOC135839847 n=1 Tax=Planococcus citri TaxID=170843 RepID=UPI0031F8A764